MVCLRFLNFRTFIHDDYIIGSRNADVLDRRFHERVEKRELSLRHSAASREFLGHRILLNCPRKGPRRDLRAYRRP